MQHDRPSLQRGDRRGGAVCMQHGRATPAPHRLTEEGLILSIKGLTEINTKPGLVNLDFNDVKTIMKGGGVAMIGLDESQAVGANRAVEAIEEAINSPLLEVDFSTAHGVLINVTGGY